MEIPQDLIKQIVKKKCIVFVGAGLSQGAGLPGWPELLQRMMNWAEEHGKDMSRRTELEKYIEDGELLLVAGLMYDRLGADDFCAFMEDVFLDQNIRPTESHEYLTQIPFAATLTTNYDTLLEAAYTLSRDDANFHVMTPSNYAGLARRLRDDDFYVLKAHGTITDIETVVLKRSDYREVMFRNPAYRRHLESLFSTKTILFVGFSLTDEDVMKFLDELKAAFGDYAGKHYALMWVEEAPSLKQEQFAKDYNIRIIPYSDHSEVPVFLKELAESCIQKEVEPELINSGHFPKFPWPEPNPQYASDAEWNNKGNWTAKITNWFDQAYLSNSKEAMQKLLDYVFAFINNVASHQPNLHSHVVTLGEKLKPYLPDELPDQQLHHRWILELLTLGIQCGVSHLFVAPHINKNDLLNSSDYSLLFLATRYLSAGYNDKARSIAREPAKGCCICCYIMGQAELKDKRYDKAKAILEKADQILNEGKHLCSFRMRPEICNKDLLNAEIQSMLGVICQKLDEYEKAEKYFRQAAESIPNVVALDNIEIESQFSVATEAHSKLKSGAVPEGLLKSFAEKGNSLSDRAYLSVRQADVEWLISDGNTVYIIEKQEEEPNIYEIRKAKRSKETIWCTYDKMPHRVIADLYFNCGCYWYKRSRFVEAEELFQQSIESLKRAKEEWAPPYIRLAIIKLISKPTDKTVVKEAVEHFNEAELICQNTIMYRETSLSLSLCNLGLKVSEDLLGEHNTDDALADLERALAAYPPLSLDPLICCLDDAENLMIKYLKKPTKELVKQFTERLRRAVEEHKR